MTNYLLAVILVAVAADLIFCSVLLHKSVSIRKRLDLLDDWESFAKQIKDHSTFHNNAAEKLSKHDIQIHNLHQKLESLDVMYSVFLAGTKESSSLTNEELSEEEYSDTKTPIIQTPPIETPTPKRFVKPGLKFMKFKLPDVKS